MSIEQNKAAVRRIISELFNKGNMAVADEIIAPDYIYHFPMMEVKGPEGFKQLISMFRSALPDMQATIKDIVAEGNMVAVTFNMQGTFKGELMGMKPTGKSLNFTEAVFIRFENGKEVEATPYADSAAMYQQLGISPPGK